MQYTNELILTRAQVKTIKKPTLIAQKLNRLQYLLSIFDRYNENMQDLFLFLTSDTRYLGDDLEKFLRRNPEGLTITDLFALDKDSVDKQKEATVTDLLPLYEETGTLYDDFDLVSLKEMSKIYTEMKLSLNMDTFSFEQLFDNALKLMQKAELSEAAVRLITAFIGKKRVEVTNLRIAELQPPQGQGSQPDFLTPESVVPKTNPSKAEAYASYQTAVKENRRPTNGSSSDLFGKKDDSQNLYLNYVAEKQGYTAIP